MSLTAHRGFARPHWVDRLERVEIACGRALALGLFAAASLVLSWVVLPWISLDEPDELARRRRMQRIVSATCRRVHGLVRLLGLHHDPYAGVRLPEGPALLVLHHSCLVDLMGLVGRMPQLCCVMRAGLVNSRLLGPVLKSCGHVSAGTSSESEGASLFALRTRIDEGFPVLVCAHEPKTLEAVASEPSLSVHDTANLARDH